MHTDLLPGSIPEHKIGESTLFDKIKYFRERPFASRFFKKFKARFKELYDVRCTMCAVRCAL